jgi:hypothetical protein
MNATNTRLSTHASSIAEGSAGVLRTDDVVDSGIPGYKEV